MNTGTKTETAGLAVVKRAYEGKIDFSEVVSHCQGDNAELIRWHLGLSAQMGRMSLAHAIFAGWLLERQKTQLGWGGWRDWCESNLGFSYKTADHYVALYKKTVGAARTPAGIGSGQVVGAEELDAATEAVDASTATGAMIELGIIKRAKDCGGDRRKQAAKNGKTVGRPAKGSAEEVAKELDAAANSEALLWSASEGAIGTLLGLDRDRDFLRRLTDEHLAVAARSLADLSKKAGELLAARLARKDMGLHGEEMETSEAVEILEGGL